MALVRFRDIQTLGGGPALPSWPVDLELKSADVVTFNLVSCKLYLS